MSNPFSGAISFIQGLGLIFKPGVKKFVIIPLLLNISLFAVAIYFLAGEFGNIVQDMLNSLPTWLSGLLNILSWLLWILFAALLLIAVFFGFTIIANIVSAPFNSYLSAAVEKHLTGSTPIDPNSGFFSIALRSITAEFKKLSYFIILIIPVLIITIIPGLNIISPFVWVIFGAWMLALEYSDYPLANHGLLFPEVRETLRQQRLKSLGFGGMATLATMIPIVNFLVMPVSIAGATAMAVKKDKTRII